MVPPNHSYMSRDSEMNKRYSVEKTTLLIIFIFLIFSNSYCQIPNKDYDTNLKFGYNLINYHRTFNSFEIGATTFKNRNRNTNSTNLYMYSISVLGGSFKGSRTFRIGLKIGIEKVSPGVSFGGLIGGVKIELLYLQDELYLQPQIGVSSLLIANLYIGYSFRILKSKNVNKPANFCFSIYFNMIDII